MRLCICVGRLGQPKERIGLREGFFVCEFYTRTDRTHMKSTILSMIYSHTYSTIRTHKHTQCEQECKNNTKNKCGDVNKISSSTLTDEADKISPSTLTDEATDEADERPKWGCECEVQSISSNDACQPLFERYGLGTDDDSVKAITKGIVGGIEGQLRFWKAADRLWSVVTTPI
jgi:hypothetical protein